ncbi:hypothetical protein [Dysgonomonas sp. 520]|uniref:hypothetical protein n=1 Tax=Dysgonomonas sp. 520 TaxID=2302931 RepID=UPI0013D86C2E|nr:hypothetical protein [Dysgonomonas sp. 520]NDW11135.1 hypothetical protein [Dysgonomonas sp. 520]
MNETNINDSYQLSIGNYEILYSSAPNGDKAVQYLNNGSVKSSDIDLKCTVKYKDEAKSSISSVDFLMPRDEAKLSDIFETTPYGLIKKNRTGVGATTLELRSKRNSIVVVPTKALAYNKAKDSKVIIDGQVKYKVQYVGSAITRFNVPTIEEYLADEVIPDKKFIVVADSLPRLLRKIGEDNYKDYFFMVDEVDSYQYDAWYRPTLENVIDYYFEFPPKKRCLVSATIGRFSNEKIEEEPVINVTFNQPQPRDIKLLHTNNVIATTVRQINSILGIDPNIKIVIAYNSVRRGILQIIESLDETLRSKCAILCSSRSKQYAGDYYSEDIINGELPNQITFMTCTYFVGIDMLERFHLISVAEGLYYQLHTLLSEDKLEQIAGRCRHEEGLISETVIYHSRARIARSVFLFPPTPETVEEETKECAQLLINHINAIITLKGIYKRLSNSYFNKFSIDDIIDNSFMRYNESKAVKLLRKDIHNNVKPAYLNIDNIVIQYKILDSLYLSEQALYESLQSQGHIVTWENVEESEERMSTQAQENLDEHIRVAEEDEIEAIIEHLRRGHTIRERIRLANRYVIEIGASDKGETFINKFLELQNYVPFEELITTLPQHNTPAKYDRFYNSVMFWALSEEHSFKIAFKQRLPLETPLNSEDIKGILNDLLGSNFGYSIGTKNKAVRDLQIFCKISERVRDRELGNPYFILNYDVNNFGTPLDIISATTNIRELFRFPTFVLTS